jgi:hypothetical protein
VAVQLLRRGSAVPESAGSLPGGVLVGHP